MHDAQAGGLHARADPRTIIALGQAGAEQISDERVHGHALRRSSRLEPLMEILVEPGDELLHTQMIADASGSAIIGSERAGLERSAPCLLAGLHL